ncbi:uncharacterized protein C8Q71DRAFT_765439 [Rhodofomes roseus]|uniref:Fungal-type protein kinase domain-containing protein n=1 Tax=Rhodofomes roseus TaxID=34475 RepID=A0ABQ8KDW9_9APHY|nr:uncharacterized protein C8Q71DRAFT_765439 [Rhodofomes roseus]KAH9835353.1 hypothetical protein C8Q71DRAFT_765439 [Rhodofomes roseus]
MCRWCSSSSPSESSSHTYSAPAWKRAFLARDLEHDIINELAQDVYCDISGFLDALFPVSGDLIEKVFAKASKSGGCYKPLRRRWSGYPIKPPASETALYASFVALVQSVTSCIPEADTRTNGLRWRDHHDHIPLSRNPCTPEVRPDIVATIGVADDKPVPWSRILVPLQVKKQEQNSPALLQLLKCMRMVFHEAMDRCFVFGVVIACANMSVYLADRAGVLGSVVINIHEEPRLFIRIIVGISSLSLADLGWDTSMAIIGQQKKYTRSQVRRWKPRLSYEVPWSREQEDQYWVIDMPQPKDGADYGVMDERMTEKFVLYKALNVQRGEVIRGRATRVWKAWLFDELTLPPEERRLFILKDMWRDDERCPEGEFYEHIGCVPGVATMRSYGVVYVDGKEDTVMSRIRRGVQVCAKPRYINASQKNIKREMIPSSMPDRTRGNTTDYGVLIDYLPFVDVPERPPGGKTHSRLIMESYGWPIKYALSLLELVQAMHDALAGYWAAYKKGVQHKDLSEGNILITAHGKKGEGHRGMVIDFDYAKFMSDATLAEDPISGTLPFMSGELLEGVPYYLRTPAGQSSDSDEPSDDEEAIPPADATPVHTFHHDLESIFWILLWYCIWRAGPALRRPLNEWQTHDSMAGEQYRRYFATSELKQLGSNKRLLIKSLEDRKRCFDVVSPYCRPLLPLIRRLWKILHIGYKARRFNEDEAYNTFLQAFQDMEISLSDKPVELSEDQERAFQAEQRRRKEDLMNWKRSPRKLARQAVDKPVAADEQTRRANEAGPAAVDTDTDEREESPTPLLRPSATPSRAQRKLVHGIMAPGPSTRALLEPPRTGGMSTGLKAQPPLPPGMSQTSAPMQTRSKKRGRERIDDVCVGVGASEQGCSAKRAKRGNDGRGRGGGRRGGRSKQGRKEKGRARSPSEG